MRIKQKINNLTDIVYICVYSYHRIFKDGGVMNRERE